jgi:multimeric flavodoxin WrbA
MKVLAINGSARRNGNTATLLNKALEGALRQGAETEIIHLTIWISKDAPAASHVKGLGVRAMANAP